MDKFVKEWNELSELYENDKRIEKGVLTWQVMNLHVYERHFKLVQ